MQMFRVEQKGVVQFLAGHFVHGAGIRQDVTLLALRKDDRKPRRFSLELSHVRNIHAARGKPLHTDIAKWIVANAGAEAYAITEVGEVVREDRRRTPQGDAQVLGQVFALQNQFLWKPVQNQIEI